ncbi:MAG: methylmalonyl Co-A mutase-associated GTPase MeaB [Phycisphaeraceae bacterium]
MVDSSPDFEHQADLPPDRSALSVSRAKPARPRGASASAARGVPSPEELAKGVRDGDRAMLGRAITLVESAAARHRSVAADLLARIMPDTGDALRVGITGVPGAGKSTFIETLGLNLTQQGRRVAVLAVDPSSGITGGSILGDKTRMARLANDENAFIRPSPAGRTLGGVAGKTRESMLLCEAAGFNVVLVETVGVGQSETVVADMTDFFLAIQLAGAGDELQGIKRGVIEIADMIAINKADGDNETRAKRAAMDYENAIRYMTPREPDWTTPVVTCSALKNLGVDELWNTIADRLRKLHADGRLREKRQGQQLRWLWAMIDDRLRQRLHDHPAVQERREAVERKVKAGELPPTLAADELLDAVFSATDRS